MVDIIIDEKDGMPLIVLDDPKPSITFLEFIGASPFIGEIFAIIDDIEMEDDSND